MTHEVLLAGVVREWTGNALPGQPAAADAAAGLALRCYAGGASVREACQEVRRFVESWAQHPSNQPVVRDEQLLVAS